MLPARGGMARARNSRTRPQAHESEGSKLRAKPLPSPVAELDRDRLLAELEVHKHELEAQNEQLRETQLALERSLERYYELYEKAPVAYLTLDGSGKVIEANAPACSLLGAKREQVVGRSFLSFATADGALAVRQLLDRAVTSGERETRELSLRTGSDAITHARAIANAVRLGREPPTCRCALIDLSELRRVEESLAESTQRLSIIADAIDDVFYIEEDGGEISYVSPAAARLLGRPPETVKLLGRGFLAAVLAEDRARIRAEHERMREGTTFDQEYRILRTNGQVRRVHHRAFPTADPTNNRLRIVGVLRDVTVQRALEEDLHHAQKMEAIGALAAGVAHDFNNVLHAVLGLATVAQSETTTPEQARDCAARIAKVAKRGGEVASRLTAFARKRSERAAAHELDGLIRDFSTLLRPLVTESIRIVVDTDAPGCLVLCEPSQIEQILMNLAANARDAMPEGGTFSIATELVFDREESRARHWPAGERGHIRLSVGDSGSGLDERTRQRVFEPFFTTKEPGKGTGLGLSTVFALVHQLDGRIDVESIVGQGTKFVIDLPLAAQPSSRSGPAGPLPRLHGKILLVEDEQLVRSGVRHYLEEIGLEVVEAAGPAEALRLVDRMAGSLLGVVTDVVMPVMMGDKLAERLLERRPGMSVLLMTANPSVLPRNGWEVIRKPFTKEELAAKLVALLPGGQPQPDRPGVKP